MNYKTLFIVGLFCEVIAQTLLAQGNEFVYALKPIDFTHWFILIGVVFMIPQVVTFPNNIFSYLGSPIALVGIVCLIGMCVLDFIWWSQPTQEIRNEFAGQIAKVPSIWKPFISFGPSILNFGLLILSFNYFKKHKLGVFIIILATLIIYFGRFIPHRLIYGYLLTAIGFSLFFYQKNHIMNTKLNKSDWIILAIVFGTTIILGCYDYYKEGNKLIEYLVDFPTDTLLSIVIILVFIQKIVPAFLVDKKNYFLFFISSFILLTITGTLANIIGRFTAGANLNSIKNVGSYLIDGLYNAVDMASFPLGILLIKKFYEGQQIVVETKKQQKENELKLLRSQIDPHFLFNNLNTLDSLIDSNPTKAKEYINRLSLIYRYLIKTKDAEVMELASEVEFAENYIFLMKTRFGDDYEFTIERNISLVDQFIPTGALQSLLENVVKHNKSDGKNAIKTSILINEGWLIITNSKSTLKSKEESFGTGLDNLRARYKLLSDEKIQVHDMDTKFEVFIPVIKLQG